MKIRLFIRRIFGKKDMQWARVVMYRETEAYLRNLDFRSMDSLEVSGNQWKNFGFKSYRNTEYPEYDLCASPLEREIFNFVIVEQVLEHVPNPRHAVENVWQMLRAGGYVLVSTPFLIRIHNFGQDYTRWSEKGLKNLLIEGGFAGETIHTGAWGNRACAKANFEDWVPWIPWFDSLENQPEFPIHVWAFARKEER